MTGHTQLCISRKREKQSIREWGGKRRVALIDKEGEIEPHISKGRQCVCVGNIGKPFLSFVKLRKSGGGEG